MSSKLVVAQPIHNNVLSYLTPLGQKLLGKKVDDLVETEVEGTVTNWKIEGLARWIDAQ